MKKFGAKKIAALAVVMALVTVGGVYATWTFNSGTKSSGVGTVSVGIASYTETSTGSAGEYNIETTTASGKVYTVDQYSDAILHIKNGLYYASGAESYDYVIVVYNGATYTLSSSSVAEDYPSGIDDHTAALCVACDSKITITFTANEIGSSAYYYGIDTQFSFSWDSNNVPKLNVDDNTHMYSSSGTETEVLALDTSVYTIYSTDTSGATKVWEKTVADGTFTYGISTAEIATYLTMNAEIIIDNTTAWTALKNALNGTEVVLDVYEAGTPLAQPEVEIDTTLRTITLTDSTNTSTDVACYYVGFMSSATDGTAAHTATIETTSLGSVVDISNLIGSLSDGTYYIRVRAVADSSSDAANSTWTTATYSVTISSGSVTSVDQLVLSTYSGV